MKQRQVRQEAEFFWQKACQIGVVEIYPGHCLNAGIVRSDGTEHPVIVANVGTNPRCRDVERIGENNLLPCLQCDVSVPQTLIIKF